MGWVTRFTVNPSRVLRVPLVSFDRVTDSVEALSRSREAKKAPSKLLRFGNADTLLYGKSKSRPGEPVDVLR